MAGLGFWRLAEETPEAIALITPEGRPVQAGELLAQCNQIVHGLRALGLKNGDSVAAVMGNDPTILALYLAVAQSGLYLVPVNHHFVAAEVGYILGDSGAKALLVSPEHAQMCRAAADLANLSSQARFSTAPCEGFLPLQTLIAGQPRTKPEQRSAGSVMNYTSGTTGKPKGVRRPLPPADPDAVAAQLAMFLSLFGLQPRGGNVHLCASPLYHTAVLNFATYSLHMGHTVAVMGKWTPEEHLRFTEQFQVTHTHMVPTQFSRLLALPEEIKQRYDVSSLTHAIHSAAPCPVDVKRRMIEWWGKVLYEYYAASEGGGTLATPEQWMSKPGTVGRPWPISEIKIFREDGQEAPTGEIGTVYIRMGEHGFSYHRDQEKTERAWSGRFFTVGDAGYVDEDGFLFLRDRKVDMIISGGVNIYPAEVEAVMSSHPWVADVAVFGIPHAEWGEEVKAAVELSAGVADTAETAAQILSYCQERLAKFKCPKSVDFVLQMPRDPNGKLFKRKLRDPYWALTGRAI